MSRDGITLSEDLRYWRAERPSEWLMDEFIRKAEKLEQRIFELEKSNDKDQRPEAAGGDND